MFVLTINGTQVSFLDELSIDDAADEYIGRDRPPDDPAYQAAWNVIWRKLEEIRRALSVRVHTGEIRAAHLYKDPQGYPDESRTYIRLRDLIELARHRGDAGQPFRSLVEEFCRVRGMEIHCPLQPKNVGRPSSGNDIRDGLRRLNARGDLTGVANEDQRRVMNLLGLKGTQKGWSATTFKRRHNEYLRSLSGAPGPA